ncbi:MAG: hypothetical protein KGL35_12745 [Bradyrhizobium sp.]|nr:hypothetical protein [Pseudomonadota bacterium]MDE2469578.1 hypothetical protein [Bradyrhizobium sp.]
MQLILINQTRLTLASDHTRLGEFLSSRHHHRQLQYSAAELLDPDES